MDSEEIFNDIVDFVTPRYYESLKFFMANRDWFPRFIDQYSTERMVIIEKINMDNEKAIDAIYKARDNWINLLKQAKNEINTTPKIQVNELTEEIISKIFDPQSILTNLVTIEFTEGITADILFNCIEKYRKQNKFFDSKKIIDQLSHEQVHIIEPWIQAAVCGYCHNFELILATYPKKESACSLCARPLSICRIYGLEPDIEIHKKRNKDLPLLVKAYFSKKLPQEDIITSHKLLKEDSKELDSDVDVYIPATKTGIECKLFVNPSPQGSQFDSAKGELVKAFEIYNKHGIKRLIGLTNLNEPESKELEKYILEKLKTKGIEPEFLKIGHFSFGNLIDILNEEIEFIKKIK